MKKSIILLSLIPFHCFSEGFALDRDYSVGAGIGAMYNGVGVNVARSTYTDLGYVAAGCTSYSTISGSSCGLSVGWIKTDLFSTDSNKHGFGLYAGKLDEENYTSYTLTNQGRVYYQHDKDIYGAGVSYTYFTNGINRPGPTYGISVHTTNAEFKSRYAGFLQVGYQF